MTVKSPGAFDFALPGPFFIYHCLPLFIAYLPLVRLLSAAYLSLVCRFRGGSFYDLPDRYSSIPFAPARPASIARMTVAAPVTASPPA